MKITIRKARKEDLSTILRLRDDARRIMQTTGNPDQWPENYPAKQTFERDIEHGTSYLCEEEGCTVGTFALVPGPEPTYSHITGGRWIDEDRAYYVLHRVASDSTAHGVFVAIIDFCKSQSDNLRVDTHRDNAIMRRLLDRHGFTYCGIIYLSDGSERLAFQWLG